MKKLILLTAFLALLILPTLTGAETWADFVARAEAAMATTENLVTIEVDEVDCYRYETDPATGHILPLDPALNVPYLKRLIIQGGSFAGMLVERGDGAVNLEGVTVRSTEVGAPAIYLLDSGEGHFLYLELGIDTLVEATGENAPAIGNMDQADDAITNRERIVVIGNYGRIRAADAVDGSAISLAYRNAGEATVNLAVMNDGAIEAPVRLIAQSRRSALVALQNNEDGKLSGEDGYLWLEANSGEGYASVSLRNDGTLRTLGPETLHDNICLMVNWKGQGSSNGADATGKIFISNDGALIGDTKLGLWTTLSPKNFLIWQDDDQGKDVPDHIALCLKWKAEAGQPTEEELLEEARTWLGRKEQRYPTLPGDTLLRVQLAKPGDFDSWTKYPGSPWTDTWAGWGLPTGD